MGKIDLIKVIYKLYIFFLPFQMFSFFHFPDIFSNYLFINASSLFMWAGLLLIIMNGLKIPYNSGVKLFSNLYLFMAIYSLLAAIILFFPLGELNGENTLRAVIGDIIFYFIALCSIYYNWYCLSYVIDFRELKSVLYIESVFLLIIGYIQLSFIWGFNGLYGLYSSLDSVVQLLEPSRLNRGIVFGGTEPSSAANLCLLIIPFHLTMIWNNQNKMINLLFILLYIPLFISSNSSTVVILLFILIITVIVMIVSSSLKPYRILAVASFGVGMIIAICYGIDSFSNYIVEFEEDSIQYLLLGKIFDTSSLSNAMRSSTIINDMKIFFSYPFTGIGNGLQGYLYNSNMPEWVRRSSEVQNIISGSAGIVDGGGAFFPVLLSGFGLCGSVVFTYFIRSYYTHYVSSGIVETELNIIFKFFIIVFLCAGWYGIGVEQNQYIAFLLALPIVDYQLKGEYMGLGEME